ncbi:MAG TPA: hypothetical protein VFQ37_05915 [Mycobacterium sp.]|nr:hypothetical protein [Mycobacterium sp.]
MSIVALIAAVAHMVWPDIKIDTITVLLLVVALVPWLGDLLDSIELPGGWKVKYRALEERQESVERAAAQADARAAEATSTAEVALGAAQTLEPAAVPATMETVRLLTEEYHRLRAQPRTQARTSELDRWFGAMVAIVPRVPDFDPGEALRDKDRGIRLAGYAFLYGRPDPAWLDEVVEALVREQTPFSQYWAIRTAVELLEHVDLSAVPDSIVTQLQDLLERLPQDTSRHAELATLLRGRREALLNPGRKRDRGF